MDLKELILAIAKRFEESEIAYFLAPRRASRPAPKL